MVDAGVMRPGLAYLVRHRQRPGGIASPAEGVAVVQQEAGVPPPGRNLLMCRQGLGMAARGGHAQRQGMTRGKAVRCKLHGPLRQRHC